MYRAGVVPEAVRKLEEEKRRKKAEEALKAEAARTAQVAVVVPQPPFIIRPPNHIDTDVTAIVGQETPTPVDSDPAAQRRAMIVALRAKAAQPRQAAEMEPLLTITPTSPSVSPHTAILSAAHQHPPIDEESSSSSAVSENESDHEEPLSPSELLRQYRSTLQYTTHDSDDQEDMDEGSSDWEIPEARRGVNGAQSESAFADRSQRLREIMATPVDAEESQRRDWAVPLPPDEDEEGFEAFEQHKQREIERIIKMLLSDPDELEKLIRSSEQEGGHGHHSTLPKGKLKLKPSKQKEEISSESEIEASEVKVERKPGPLRSAVMKIEDSLRTKMGGTREL